MQTNVTTRKVKGRGKMESLTFPADFLTVQGYQAEESPQDTENHDTLHVVEPVKVDYSLAVEFG